MGLDLLDLAHHAATPEPGTSGKYYWDLGLSLEGKTKKTKQKKTDIDPT